MVERDGVKGEKEKEMEEMEEMGKMMVMLLFDADYVIVKQDFS